MKFYDIELVDKDPTIDNFKFTKVSQEDLDKIKHSLKTRDKFLEFNSKEGNSVLDTTFFRGLFYNEHDINKSSKSALRETFENSVEIAKVKNKKP